jgi:hypothetical protein
MAKPKRAAKTRHRLADPGSSALLATPDETVVISDDGLSDRERAEIEKFLGPDVDLAAVDGTLLSSLTSKLSNLDRARETFDRRSKQIEEARAASSPTLPVLSDLTIGRLAAFYYLYGLVALRGAAVIERVQANAPEDAYEESLVSALQNEFRSPLDGLSESGVLAGEATSDVAMTTSMAPWLNARLESREALLAVGQQILSTLRAQLTETQTQLETVTQQLAAAEEKNERLQRKADERTGEAQTARGELERARQHAERETARVRQMVEELQAQLAEARSRPAPPTAGMAVPVAVSEHRGGRGVYSTWLRVEDPQQFEFVVERLGRWIADESGCDAAQLCELPLRAGRRHLAAGERNVTVDVLVSDDSRLWEVSWRQPYGPRDTLMLHTTMTVVGDSSQLWFSVTARLQATAPRMYPISYEFEAPAVVAELISDLPCTDGGMRFVLRAHQLTAEGVAPWSHSVLENPRRTRPVIVLSCTAPRELVQLLPSAVSGLAHTFVLADHDAEQELISVMGRQRAVWGGAVRVYFEGADAQERSDWLYTKLRVEKIGAERLASELFSRLTSAASLALYPPKLLDDVRAEALRQHRAERTAGARAGQIPDEWIDEMEALEGQLADTQARLAGAHEETQRLQYLLDKERARRRYSLSQAGHTDDGGELPQDTPLPEVKTVFEAVTVAQELCRHLVFSERSFETAADSPFEAPGMVLRDLMLLDRVAEAYAQPDGIGMSMMDHARQMGLEWRQDVGDQWPAKHPGLYSFRHEGVTIFVKEHIRVANGAGATRLARIYFRLVDGSDPEFGGLPRGVYIGPVGRKLPDSTTG